MEMREEAGFADAVCAEKGFQFKNGAAFAWGSRRTAFDNSGDTARLNVTSDTDEQYELTARFVLDASGYGRVLPRLLNLETPSHLPPRMAHFTRITDNIAADADFDRNKILITTHPQHRDVWFWTIPFGDNTCSLGVVGTPDKLSGDSEAVLKQIVAECPNLVEFFKHSEWENGFPYRSIQGYSADGGRKRFSHLCGRLVRQPFPKRGVRTQQRARNQPHDFRHSRGLCVGYGKPVCRKIGTAAEHAGGTGGGFGV